MYRLAFGNFDPHFESHFETRKLERASYDFLAIGKTFFFIVLVQNSSILLFQFELEYVWIRGRVAKVLSLKSKGHELDTLACPVVKIANHC